MLYLAPMKSTTSIMLSLFGAGMLGGLLASRKRSRAQLGGQVAWVTGGSRGLGLEIARELLARDVRVVLSARDAKALERAREQLDADAEQVVLLPCDVTDPAAIQSATKCIVSRFGGIDLLFNCAGVIQVGPLDLLSYADFEKAMQTHFWAPLHTMKAVAKVMRQQGRGGRMVNIASMGGVVAMPHMAAYCASKFALVGLSDAFRAELASYGIQVLTACPGMMRTGSHVNATFKGAHGDEYAWFSASNGVPGLSINAHNAAQAIVEACAQGRNRLDLSAPAHAGRLAQALAPNLLADAMKLLARSLPSVPDTLGQEILLKGSQARTGATDALTKLSDAAAHRNNEIVPNA